MLRTSILAAFCFLVLGPAPGVFAESIPDLVAWWAFDEGQGTVANDWSESGLNATVNGGATWVPGKSRTALQFNGSSSYVEAPYIPLNSRSFTVTMWVNPVLYAAAQIVFGQHQSGAANLSMHYRLGGPAGTGPVPGAVRMAFYSNDLNTAGGLILDNTWYHLTFWYDAAGQTQRIYINGVQSAQRTAAPYLGTAGLTNIGRWHSGTPQWFRGMIDDVQIYYRALTNAEIQKIMTGLVDTSLAYDPDPKDKAVGVTQPLFQWKAGSSALFHNVYFGTSPDLTEADRVATRQPFAMYFHVPGLQPGVTYYWRVDEIGADLTTVHTGPVWSFATTPLTAFGPRPADGAADLFPSQKLSWQAGQQAAKHQVYFSNDFAAVSNGAAAADKGQVTEAVFTTDVLRSSTTYYWRVDEIQANGTVSQGAVWSFSTSDGVAHKVMRQWWANITGTGVTDLTNHANYPNKPTGSELLDLFEGPTNWADNYGSRLYGWLTPPQSGDYTFWMASDDYGELRLSTDADPANTRVIATVPGWATSQEWGKYPAQKSAVITLQAGQKYYIQAVMKEGTGGDNIAVSWQGPGIATQEVIKAQYMDTFALPPLQAFSPSPANGAVDTPQALTLSWSAGDKAQRHEVYFGDDKEAVAAANATSLLFKGSQTATTFNTGDLGWGKTYYWRVDETSPAEADSPWKGAVWSFTTADFVAIDDMESYTDEEGNRIYETWEDGWTNGTGSTVGNLTAPFAERTIVHGGKQAMPLDYNNTKTPFYSEAGQTFAPLQNWSGQEVADLSLWFRGNLVRYVDKGNGAFTVGGSGTDIWGNADDFRFVYKRLSGNGTVTVKLESITNTNAWAKGGVMIRESLEAGSKFAYVVSTPAQGVSFGWRNVTNAACGSMTQAGLPTTHWVKLTRTGDVFTAQYSANGTTWTDIKNADGTATATTVTMMGSVYIGLCVTSHNAAAATTAQFSGAATTGGVTGAWQEVWIGDDPDLTNGAAGLYVVVEDNTGKSAVATHSDPLAANLSAWTEWKIPLSSLTGVNLARVKKLSIGVGDKKAPVPGASGRVYIDDIRLIK
jgi:hypothetical protein